MKPIAKWIAAAGITIILIAMIVGPVFSPDVFSLLHHTTSEQAGQHLAGAWIMRTGFTAYGASILFAALIDRKRRPVVRAALSIFGLGLIGTAIWSNAPILDGVPADMDEDWWHSVASGVVGTAFALACAARLFAPQGNRTDLLSWLGLIIAVFVPISMAGLPEIRGLLQRGMFVYSFIFVIREFAERDHSAEG